MSTKGLIRSYEPTKFMSVIYTGGEVLVSNNGKFFACASGDNINLIDFETGQILNHLEGV